MSAQSVEVFPRLAEAFGQHPEMSPTAMVASHPRLVRKVEALWGTREALRYLDSLMLSDRHSRHGFSEKVLTELTYLKQTHEAAFPGLGINPHDPFAAAAAHISRSDLEAHEAPAHQDLGTQARRDGIPELAAQELPADQAALALHPRTSPWREVQAVDEFRQVLEARHRGEAAPAKDSRRLGEILRDHGLVRPDTLEAALHVQKGQAIGHEAIGRILQKMGIVGEADVTRALCEQSGILMVDLHALYIETTTMRKVPIDIARSFRAVPVAVMEGHLFLAVEDPLAFAHREYFAFLTNLNVELVFAAGNRMTQRLADYGQSQSAAETDQEFRNLAKRAFVQMPAKATMPSAPVDGTRISEEDATVIGLVNKMINDAAAVGASDIHLEGFPGNGFTRIRFRRDGHLEDYSEFSAAYHEAVVSRIKIMSDLDISERRKPQDGKIYFVRPGNGQMDLRVATIPTIRGIEDVTIRLLPAGEPMAIDSIGMSDRDLATFKRMITKPYGLILVCGPTGSGKTTTLHSALRELNTPDRKIWTAEDPVEIVQKNICQVQVNPKIGWTFANALRAFLRADPDVIMIGEMRDQETARIALEASMTGHLVLSTLHTNSASETATRLLDLGADPYNLADAVLGILAQRLARRLCSACAERVPLAGTELDELAGEYYFSGKMRQPSFAEREIIVAEWRRTLGHDGELALWQSKGCDQCGGAGYRGRLGLYEVLEGTPAIRRLIRSQASAADFQQTAIAEGMATLKQDGILKALRGKTDMLQVRSACI
jgi:type II secretory ATPase GspE/PulE/Tfp pilus assembly ATPase PilB-like protein